MSKSALMILSFAVVISAIFLAGCSAPVASQVIPSPQAAPVLSPTLTASPFPTASPTATATPTETPTATATPSPSPSSTPTITPTPTPVPLQSAVFQIHPDGVHRTAHVPILMYHYISIPPRNADRIRRDLSLPPKLFREHLEYLSSHGYHTITLEELALHLLEGKPLPPKPIILTFDDGYRDNYENAFPLLREYHFKGVFFVITDFVTKGSPRYMSWEQLREMANAGMEIESHTRNHTDMRGRSVDYLVWQALGSKEAIEAHLGLTPRFVSWPSGKYDQRAIQVFRSAHFWGGVTERQGALQDSDHMFELERIRIRGYYTSRSLAWLLDHYR